MTADMEGIMNLAAKHDLKVLEDCCEATGAKYQGKYVGNVADAGAFSFDFGKVITTGEGGMVTTDKFNLDKFSREYHDHGHENNPDYPRGRDTKTIFGFNYRMTEMQAAVGKVQLSKLHMILEKNKERYMAIEENLDKSFTRRQIHQHSEPIFDTFIFQVKEKERRDEIINLLNKEKFGTKNLPDAIEWHCAYYWDHALSEEQIQRTKKSKEHLHTMIAIPIWLKRTPEDYLELAHKINKFIS
jgi:8-amino-3,8-dideoxy-alpha-D-manno-octulosonate transaminase